MRCSACLASRARLTFFGIAVLVTAVAVSPLVWAGWHGTPPAVPGWWHAVGACGPAIAAWFIARREDGSEGVADWRERILDVRVGIGWWGVAFGLPLVLLAVSVPVARVFAGDPSMPWDAAALADRLSDPAWGLGTMVIGAVAYGLLGEAGWRGWLYPHLRMSHGPLAATLLLVPMWLAWHAPFFGYRLPATLPALAGVAFSVLCGAIVLSWLVEATGSATPAMAFHVSGTMAMQVALVAAPAALIAMNALLAVVAAAVVVRWWLVPRRAAVDIADRARAFDGHPTAVLH